MNHITFIFILNNHLLTKVRAYYAVYIHFKYITYMYTTINYLNTFLKGLCIKVKFNFSEIIMYS